MADVRLTATNPQDSSVVPVACNERGELKLEEPIAPPEFDGNLDGDLTVSGSAEFAGDVFIGNSDFYNKFYASGTHEIFNKDWPNSNNALDIKGSSGSVAKILGNGSALFAGRDIRFDADGHVNTKAAFISDREGNNSAFIARENGTQNVNIRTDGSATFAGGKAGFTAQGHLWCTTRRGDTVILDATSQGMGIWESYTPARDAIKDKLESVTDIDNPRQTRD